MDHTWKFWALGGDQRQVWMSRLLAQEGHTVFTYGMEDGVKPQPHLFIESHLEGIGAADCVLLPLPVTDGQGNLNAPLSAGQHPLLPILDRLNCRQVVLGGRIDATTVAAARARGLTLLDYFDREELAVANSVPTAEGCLQIAMEHLPSTIHGTRTLILGFGRVGRVTAHRFSALGARVTVAARRCETRTQCQVWGYEAMPLPLNPEQLHRFDLVINTVPALLLGVEELGALSPDCLVIDLASRPGGVDFESAARLRRTAIHALSLPGKVAPAAAGAAIKNTVCSMLLELGI